MYASAIHVAYYDQCWQHKPLGGRAPAMAAEITGPPLSMEELFVRVMQDAK